MEQFRARRTTSLTRAECRHCESAARSLRKLEGNGVPVRELRAALSVRTTQCGICRKPLARVAALETPRIDHCHTTQRVRGLLCNRCNRALGMFEDDLALLERAIRYLQRFSRRIPPATTPPHIG